jgi:hypothetical protein
VDPVTAPPAPLLLVIDGNSLLHRAYHAAATGRLRGDDGSPAAALIGGDPGEHDCIFAAEPTVRSWLRTREW